MDAFRIMAPTLPRGDNRTVIRVAPSTYDRMRVLSSETGVSMCHIVDLCVAFALEHLYDDEQPPRSARTATRI